MRVEAPCPACGKAELDYTSADLDIPHFPQSMQLIFDCAACGFRHSDFLLGSLKEPTRFRYAVAGADDMMVRVVRSTSGTIRIPELGILIEPGPASDAYVSNIEGVLVRVESVVTQLMRDADAPDQKSAAQRRLADIQRARDGRFPFTFILEDPFGNSAIVHEGAKSEPIPPDEAEALKTGAYTLEMQSHIPAGPGGNGHGGDGPGATPS